MPNNPETQSPKSDIRESRAMRVAVSLTFIAMIAAGLSLSVSDRTFIGATMVALLYAAYLLLEGLLITAFAAVLYQQHRVREFRFGIGAIMIVSAILAVLWGFASTFSGIATVNADQVRRVSAAQPFIASLIVLFFSLVPVFLLSEATMMSYARFTHRRRQSNQSSD